MFQIIRSVPVGKSIYLMEAAGRKGENIAGTPGQFYMIRVPDSFMVLGRPVSIMDIRGSRIFFLYKVIGEGTRLLSKLKEGDEILLHGPYGRGYPVREYEDKRVALVGGGMGIAPLLFTARSLKNCRLFLGLNSSDVSKTQQEELLKLFSSYGDCSLYLDADMTALIDFSEFDALMTCGPEIMMRKLTEKHGNVYLSLERHMACGVGACMACTCEGNQKRLKVCKDGPVFHQSEVILHD